MDKQCVEKYDLSGVMTPCYVVFEEALEYNLSMLRHVMEQTGCRILLALKCFSMVRAFPLIREALNGICASGLHEARLGKEFFGKEVHASAAGFSEQDIQELAPLCEHLVFNSFFQKQRFGKRTLQLNPGLKLGMRCNPEHSEGGVPMYDPCAPGSRLGIIREEFKPELLEDISGLHFHTLCEMNADALVRTLEAFVQSFGEFLPRMSWVNFGGGHHITRQDYDLDRLVSLLKYFMNQYPHLTVYLEPGEAVAFHAGVLVSTVLDVTRNHDNTNVILDTSAACHMPDVLEMPYRPSIAGAGRPGEKAWTCQLGGISCLAGDVIGSYSFDQPLAYGDRITFFDMASYTMVKTNTFNGVRLPWIYFCEKNGNLELVKQFGYEDFRNSL